MLPKIKPLHVYSIMCLIGTAICTMMFSYKYFPKDLKIIIVKKTGFIFSFEIAYNLYIRL